MKRLSAPTLALCIALASLVPAQASGLREVCASSAREAGLQGSAAQRFERRCMASQPAAIVFSDPLCRKAALDTSASRKAAAQLENLSAARRRSGEDCQIEKAMLDVNDAMLTLIDQSPSHCGHTSAGIDLMRASQQAMKRIGC